MFNLIVSYDTASWEGNGRMTSPVERFNTYSGEEALSVSATKPETLKPLESILSILMYEKGAPGENVHRARLGFVSDILVENKTHVSWNGKQTWITQELTFEFELLGELSQFDILSSSEDLHFRKWEETRTHWAIKDGRIPIEMLKKAIGATSPPTEQDEVLAMLALPAENDVVEFKETLYWSIAEGRYSNDQVDRTYKAICAMLNRNGGTVLIGVRNSDHKPIGIEKDVERLKSFDGFQRKVHEQFGVKLLPDPSDLIRVRPVSIDGVTIARIDVRPDCGGPYELNQKVYVRRDGESRELGGQSLAHWWERRRVEQE